MSDSYHLFGKQFTPSQGLHNYNVFRNEVLLSVKSVSAEVHTKFNSASNIEELIEGTQSTYSALLGKVIDDCVNCLNKNNIFDLDKKLFFDTHVKQYKLKFEEVHDTLVDRYESILENEAEKDAYRTARRQGRSRWVGFTDQGRLDAGINNAAMGALHGTVNILGKIGSSIGASMKKSAIFNDHELRTALVEAALSDARALHYTLAARFKAKGGQVTTISSENVRKAGYMLENLDIKADREHALTTIIEMLELNPYNFEIYEYLLRKFDDRNGEVTALATAFGLAERIENYKQDLLQRYFDVLPKDTLEEAKKSKGELATLCEALAIKEDNCTKEMDNIIIECKHKCALEIFESMPKSTEEEAFLVKDAIIAFCQKEELGEDTPAMAKIHAVLAQIDQDIRTVEGIIFETREIASQARLDKSSIEEIITSIPLIFKGDFSALSDKIKSGSFNDKIEALYLKYVDDTVAEFDKKLNLAKNYAYKKQNNKKFSGGFKNLFSDVKNLLGSTNEEETWKELTHDGKFSLEDVDSDQASPSSLSISGYPLKMESKKRKLFAGWGSNNEDTSVSHAGSTNPPPVATTADTDLPNNSYEAGQTVFARYAKGNTYYPGTISAVNGSQVDIAFLDGDKETMPAGDVLALQKALSTLKLQGNFNKGFSWYSGKISKTEPLTMQYDDGDVEQIELKQLRGTL